MLRQSRFELGGTVALSLTESVGVALFVLLVFAAALTFQSPIVLLVPIAFVLAITAVRYPFSSLLGYICLNIVLGVLDKDSVTPMQPTPVQMLCGAALAFIGTYWLILRRTFHTEASAHCKEELGIQVFYAWGILVTIACLGLPHHSPNLAARELLNFLPLVLIPVLYRVGVGIDLRKQNILFGFIILAAVAFEVHNLLVMSSNVAHAVYLFQTGRANTGEVFSIYLVLLSTALLSTKRSATVRVGLYVLIAISIIGIIVSFARAIYLSTIASMIVLFWLSGKGERRRIAFIWLQFLGIATIILIPLLAKFRILRLLLINYVHRFSTSTNIKTDRSLRDRYEEWTHIWSAIKESPLLGHGFGSLYKNFDILTYNNDYRSYSHSSYLFLIFKVGFVAAILFYAVFAAAIWKGFKLSRDQQLPLRVRLVARACTAALIAFLMDCYASPVLNSKTDLLWIGIIWGFIFVTDATYKNSRVDYSLGN